MQRLVNSTLADALTAGCDTVQLKYEGYGVQVCAARGGYSVRDFSQREVANRTSGIDPSITCTLIACLSPFDKSLHVFDCWHIEEDGTGVDLRGEPYRSRYVAAKIQCQLIGASLRLVTNFPISKSPALWATLAHTAGVRGLIFRNSRDPVSAPVRVARWYAETPRELT